MNRETIIQIAREAGLAEVTDTAESLPADYVEALAKLCTLSVAKEREECAKDDEGAIALYERPQEVGLTDEDRADMACAVAAICTGTSSRTVAATAIEWTERALRAKGQT